MKFVKLKGSQNKNLFRRGEVYWVRASRSGFPRLEKSLKTDDLVRAREMRDQEMAAHFTKNKLEEKKHALACDKFEDWVHRPCDWRESTRAHIYFLWKKHLKEYFGNCHLDEITPQAWLRYVEIKRAENPNRTFANERKYLTAFMNWCLKLGYINKKPDFENVDLGAKEGRAYEEHEIEALLKHATKDLRLQILMGITMGMRKGEILSLEWKQINFDRQFIHLPKEKTKINKARTFAISDKVFEILKARKEKAVSDWVFPSRIDKTKAVGREGNKSAWKSCKAKAGVKGTFHGLRHTFLTRAFKTAINPMLVCEYAGLSIEVAQKVYLHSNEDYTREVANLVKG